MRLHRNGEHRIVLILVLITCGISWASMQCKMVVMDVHMRRCRLGAGRTKRATERFDFQKYDEKSKRQEGPDYSTESHDFSAPQKRQLTPGRIGDIILPIAVETANRARTYTTSGTGYYDPGPSLIERIYGRPGYYPSSSYPPGKSITPFRAPTLRIFEDFGLDLNNEELEELYNDIYERLPRAPKEEAWKAFLETASKCCQNIDRCKKETTHIPCLAV
ncbi:hypothetical protein X777_10985 [Ooceraea biroi]|nr:hypothetical protein X777_10985 [Ooceraea biroi]